MARSLTIHSLPNRAALKVYHRCGMSVSGSRSPRPQVCRMTNIYSVDELWATLVDVEQWPHWNHKIIASQLDQPRRGVQTGSTGTIFTGKSLPFTMVDLETNHYFAYGKIQGNNL